MKIAHSLAFVCLFAFAGAACAQQPAARRARGPRRQTGGARRGRGQAGAQRQVAGMLEAGGIRRAFTAGRARPS